MATVCRTAEYEPVKPPSFRHHQIAIKPIFSLTIRVATSRYASTDETFCGG
jgi:hypothetical protein